MHHKRKRPKNRRAGCLLCKPHKANGCLPRHRDMRASDRRRCEAEWVTSGDKRWSHPEPRPVAP